MSFVKLGVVVPRGEVTEFDALQTYGPSAMVRDGKVWLYYTGYLDTTFRIGLAVSEDGIHFTKLGVVLPLGATGEFDATHTYSPIVLERSGKIWMYYTGAGTVSWYGGLAVSEDGIHFTKLGLVVPKGAAGEFDDVSMHIAGVLERDGKVWLYYAGNPLSNYYVGLAVSEDGVHFTKLGVVIPLGADGEFDDVRAERVSVLERDGKIWAYETGGDGSNYYVGLAVSEDGIHFTKLGVVLPRGATNDFDDTRTYLCGAVERDGKLWVYYGGQHTSSRVGLAVSECGL